MLTASAWPESGDIVLITCIAEGPYSAQVAPGLETEEIGIWPKIGRILPFGFRLQSIVRKHRLSTLVTNGYGLNQMVLLARAVGLVRDVRIVVVEHNTLSVALTDRFESRVVRSVVLLLTRWLYRRADAIVGVSDGVSRDLEAALGLPAGSVTTIYNPVDTNRITAAIDEQVPKHLEAAFFRLSHPVVITTGRLVAAKAHHDLLDAFALLPESHRGSLVILGEGPLRGELEEQARHLGVADRIWMPGFIDNPWWFIARADVFALSSHWEGHPLVLLEALACGVQIVSTDCPSGPAEILEGVPSARLTPVADPAALAGSISDLLMHPRDSAGTIDMHRYAPNTVAAHYHDVVNRVTTRTPRQWRQASL